MAETALELGGRAAIHAIGDAAVDRAVALAEDIEAPEGSIRIEHASVVDRATIGRMASAGVVASVQPSFVLSDAPFLLRRLGPDRIRNAYPFRTMMEAGVSLIAGSDAPIEDPQPLAGIAAAMHRGGFQGAESLDLDAALAIHTVHTLSPGDPADLVIVEGDITSGDMTPVAVVIGGEVVHDRRWGATSEG
jgi:predicted amidohydrolase YtcJ